MVLKFNRSFFRFIRTDSCGARLSAFSFLLMLLPLASRAQDTSWTNAGSGFWTNAASWSLGTAPSNNPNVNITNAGSKTVTIDAGTTVGNLTITNLYIAALGGATNTLLLSGNSTPLNVLGSLSVGYSAGGLGSLVVNGGQLLTTNSIAHIGFNGVGTATVSNGTWLASQEWVGENPGAQGTLNIAGGTNLLSNILVIGHWGNGAVLVTGGQLVTTNAALTYVGNNSVGSMTVSNGTWLAAGQILVGNNAGAQGTLNLAGGSSLLQEIDVGNNAGAQGVLNITGGTNLLSGILVVGYQANATGAVVMTGGQLVTTNGIAYVGNNGVGAMTVSNGTWLANQGWVGANAGSQGALTLAGGSSLFSGDLVLGYNANATGTAVMTGGQLVTTNAVNYVGLAGLGTMTVSNGTWLTSTVKVGNSAGSRGTLNIAGGTNLISGILTVGSATGATGTVNVTGGLLAITNTSGTAQLVVGASGLGTLTLGGGTLVMDQLLVTNGANSSFSASGGNLVAGSAIIGSSFSLTNSTGIFSNLTVTSSGSLSGTGGVFVLSHDFINQSTNRTQFNLSRSTLFFTNGAGTTVHTLNLTNSLAVDMGSNWLNVAQLSTNFSIGTLRIALSNNVTLTGMKSGATTNALYVGWLDLTAWNTNATVLSTTLSNALTLPNINLYYDASDTRNAYLQDASYALWGGGGLLIPIPEPSALMLTLVTGVFSVLLLRRKGGRA